MVEVTEATEAGEMVKEEFPVRVGGAEEVARLVIV